MPKIHLLPKETAELIAAGEVVERPASVVKELLENAIDAGADKITVEIKNGGVKVIRITDNGCGIERGDIKTAFLSHATSKINTAEDLEAVRTFGFRGEALPSAAAVSRMEVLTRTDGEQAGSRYIIEGGAEISLDDAGCPSGTTIIVRDLFYNVPARMKFLKKDASEGNYVTDTVQKTALSHPEVSIRYITDDKERLLTPGDGKLSSAVYAVLGKDFFENSISAEYELSGIKISGFISKPLFARPNRNMQYYFVNSRYVRLPVAAAALDEAYKNSIAASKFPSAVLFLEIVPGAVDVNVHPAKTEVRFSDDRRVFETVYYAAKNALSKETEKPAFTMPKNEPEPQKPAPQTFFQHIKASDYIQQPVTRLEDGTSNYDTDSKAQFTMHSLQFTDNILSSPNNDVSELKEKPKETENSQLSTLNSQFKVIGEAFKTYIIVESEDKLLIIDKHAAHERMIFNDLKSREIEGHSQRLLTPVVINLASNEYAAVIENLPLFEDAGFSAEDFGGGSIMVRGCPADIGIGDIESLFSSFAEYLLKSGKDLQSEKADRLYHETACKAAVKAGSDMSAYETGLFVEKLLKDGNIRYCPHGRPVITELSKRDVEKQFLR